MKTPLYILEKFEQSSEGIEYGDVTLKLSIKFGKFRYIVGCEESFIMSSEADTEKKTQ